MKSLAAVLRVVLLSLSLGVAGFLAGCATTPQVDWTARLGEFTFDQAVAELGQPTNQAKQGDGKLVAEWVSRSPYNNGGVGVSGYSNVGGMSPGFGNYRDRVLRLTFGEDGKLQNWHRNY